MKKIVSYIMVLSLVSVSCAAPLEVAKKTAKALTDQYFKTEAETMAPLTESIYAEPYADMVALDQAESMQNIAQQLADLVNTYAPEQLYQELQKFAVSNSYTLAILIGAITTYQVYKHVTRPTTKK